MMYMLQLKMQTWNFSYIQLFQFHRMLCFQNSIAFVLHMSRLPMKTIYFYAGLELAYS